MRRNPLHRCILLALPAVLLSACRSMADDPAGAEDSQSPGVEHEAEKPRANQLANETSPYLLLHAHNPVDWHPWSEEAFAKAKAENKPIFLSIGYSSCYWCHVMERLVFENEEIAAYMNEHFVNIKVDREERPDVDDLYMLSLQVYFQAVGSPQGGGWPLSMFLTPDRQPFAGGTYFPPEDQPGRPGFPGVLRKVHDLWENRSAELTSNAEFITREVQRRTRPRFDLEPAAPERSLVDATVRSLTESFDAKHGGFGFDPNAPHGPKFPTPPNLMLLQDQAGRGGSSEPLRMLDETLRQMAAGGIRDHLGGGFHRYSVDRFWRVPHFEKMLYDNAQLAEVYAEAYRRTENPLYRQVAEETLDFVLRELQDDAGGFHSALDAETDGIEGAFYVWSPEEIRELLGEERADLFAKVYGLDQDEFFEHGYVLHLPVPLAQAAEQLEVPESELREQLAAMRAELLAKRNQREPLLKDDKVLASWNGLMIRALARAGAAFDRPDYVEAAARAAKFITTDMCNAEGRLLHTYRLGDARLNAYLDDYAYLVSGLLALHTVTDEASWLEEARSLTDAQIDLFYDENLHAFFFTPDDHEPLLARSKESYDSVVPAGNSVAVENLVRIAKLTGEARYGDVAYATLAVFAPEMQHRPAAFSYAALALQQYLDAFGAGPATEQIALAEQAPANPDPSNAPKLTPIAAMTDQDAMRHEKINAQAYLSVDRLPAGGSCKLAVVIDVDDGWHINANPAKPDFLVATELTVTATQKSKLSEVAYPKGGALQLEGFDEALSVYEGRVVLIGTMDIPPSATQSEELEISLRYQACNDAMCLRPLTLKLRAKLPVAPAGTAVRAINGPLFEKPRESD